ncbi:MAG: isocitrate lyase/phosphoenolpyruvate mutase family protein [Actinomycetota bacterium]
MTSPFVPLPLDLAVVAETGQRFRDLHGSGTFVMANVADAGTAAAVAGVGIEAIATTSSAHATTIGRSDAAGEVSMEEHAEHTELLVRAVSVPCNVDAENGYGHEPEDMAAAVERFAATGAAGMGIEDWSGDRSIGLYDRAKAIARIEAAVEAANALDRPFTITGRTEILLYGLDGGLPEVMARLQGMAEVGAHCLYAPGTWDLETIRTVVGEAGGPVNVLLPLGRPSFVPASSPSLGYDELAEAGVRRISIGGSLYNAQVNFAADLMRRTLSGGVFATPVME